MDLTLHIITIVNAANLAYIPLCKCLLLVGLVGFLSGTFFCPDQNLYWSTGVALVLWCGLTTWKHSQGGLPKCFVWAELAVLMGTAMGYFVPLEVERVDESWVRFLRPLSLSL